MLQLIRDLFLLPAILRRASDGERRLRKVEADLEEQSECIHELAHQIVILNPGWSGFDAPEDRQPGGRSFSSAPAESAS